MPSGTSNGALTCHLLNSRALSADKSGVVDVLHELGRPSLVRTMLTAHDEGNIEAVIVGGCAIKTLSGQFLF